MRDLLGTALVSAPSRLSPISLARAQATEPAVPAISYPETRRSDVVEERFGDRIADPYR
jgi:hypothetical protein